MEKLLRVGQVAELLGVSKSAVWLYVRQNKLPKPTKLSPRVSIWKLEDIMAFVEEMSA